MSNIAQNKKTLKSKKNIINVLQNWPLYVMLVPGIVLTFLFCYLPMFGIIIAFKKVNLRDGIFSSPWVGFDNFELLLRNANAWVSLRNTILYNLVFIFTGLVISVAIAVLLSMIRNKLASKVYQTIYIMPHFLSMVIVANLVLAFLNMESGFINNTVLFFSYVNNIRIVYIAVI